MQKFIAFFAIAVLFVLSSVARATSPTSITSISIIQVDGQPTPTGWDGKVFKPGSGNRTVTVQATTNPAASGYTVNWSWQDPDQEAGHVPDMHDGVGNDNQGSAWAFNGSATTTSTTDGNGHATATFTPSSYGGDNYIIKAAVTSAPTAQGLTTQTSTVWKRMNFEGPDALPGYAIDASPIDNELAQVYVVRSVTPYTSDVINATDPELSNGGAYGPTGQYDPISLALRYDESDPSNIPSGLPDWQLVTVRAESSSANEISNIAKEPYNATTAYTFGTVATPDGGAVLDFGNQGDLSTNELNLVSNFTQRSNHFIMFYDDSTAIESKMFGVSLADRRKRSLWHEVGHALGLEHPTTTADATSIMNQMPNISSQDGINRSRALVTGMHWSYNEGVNVRYGSGAGG